MMVTQVKALVSRLFADQAFLHTFLREPDTALDGQALSAAERRTLYRLHARLVTAGGAGELGRGSLYPWP